jgi:hypothetical protein
MTPLKLATWRIGVLAMAVAVAEPGIAVTPMAR